MIALRPRAAPRRDTEYGPRSPGAWPHAALRRRSISPEALNLDYSAQVGQSALSLCMCLLLYVYLLYWILLSIFTLHFALCTFTFILHWDSPFLENSMGFLSG